MGGNAFKIDANVITSKDVFEIMNKVKNLFPDLEIAGVGSTLKSDVVNDIDLAIGPISIKDLAARIDSMKKHFAASRKYGNTFSTAFYCGNRIYQVDFMPCENCKDTAWLMSGGDPGGVKGVMRNLLLSYMARRKSTELTEETKKRTQIKISFPGGCKVYHGTPPTLMSGPTSDPKVILKTLGIDADPESCLTFESLVDNIPESKDETFREMFENYCMRSWIYKKDPSVVIKAIELINKAALSSDSNIKERKHSKTISR